MTGKPAIESGGGPLAILPKSKAPLWRGIDNDDYAHACGIDGFIGIVARPYGDVIILGDEPARTYPLGDRLARWIYAPDEPSFLAAVAAFDPSKAKLESELEISLSDEPYLIFDSANPEPEGLFFQPPSGRVKLLTYYERTKEISFVLHLLKKI